MKLRIENGMGRGEEIAITVDGISVTAYTGETVASALLAAGVRALRASPRNHENRGCFCLMGACQECLVRINGKRRLACQTRVTHGLAVETTTHHG